MPQRTASNSTVSMMRTMLLLLLLLLQSRCAHAARSAVSGFELWDAATQTKIVTLEDGATVPMRPGGFNLRAVVEWRIGSLEFVHHKNNNDDESSVHVENYRPYFLCADMAGLPYRCPTLVEGVHTITVTPFAFHYALGPAAKSNSITFTIVSPDGPSVVVESVVVTDGGDDAAVPTPVAATTTTTTKPVPAPTPAAVPPATTPVASVKPPTTAAINSTTTTSTVTSTTATDGDFATIRINCGGTTHKDAEGNVWMADQYFVPMAAGVETGTFVVASHVTILGTVEDPLFQSERWGLFQYEIPLPPGDYQVILHFAEIFHNTTGSRKFGLVVEDQVVPEFDIILLAGASFTATRREIPTLVKDGFLSIKAAKFVEHPKISAIEIKSVGAHLAHSVPGGPYAAVADDDGFGLVAVDGTQSHTHEPGATLSTFTWKEGSVVLGEGSKASLKLAVGSHDVTLKVTDSKGNDSIAGTVVNVLPNGFPDITQITPSKGKLQGGDKVFIIGKGFKTASGIQFGDKYIPKSDISITSDSEIVLLVPPSNFAVPVEVAVESTLGESNAEVFTYEVDGVSIAFSVKQLLATEKPTVVKFGPDSKLYIGSSDGVITKCTLDDTYTKVLDKVTAEVAPGRFILGMAFDPTETLESNPNPTVYFSHSKMFHGEWRNSFGDAINGKISKATGAELDEVTDVVTGLPVSDHDHGINGIIFADNGDLYIQLGGNTNAGIPGELSSSQKMNESILSGATLVAHLGRADFDGHITYDDDNNGDIVTGGGPSGVEVYASGMRNPYGILLHSNGKLYGTDNGANVDFGDVATGCDPGDQIPDKATKDELNLIQKGNWYGHANHKRAETAPRECVWNGPGHTEPIMELDSSTDGIIEFESDHFSGQLRGDIIVSKFKDGLRRIVLNESGTGVHSSLDGEIKLQGDDGLDIAQAPNGVLVDARFDVNSCYFFEPIEPASTVMEIKAVFPRRGLFKGGSKISIYGVNFATTAAPLVTVGGKSCAGAVRLSSSKIQCTLPANLAGSTVDITVTIGSATDTFARGYRYIKGSA